MVERKRRNKYKRFTTNLLESAGRRYPGIWTGPDQKLRDAKTPTSSISKSDVHVGKYPLFFKLAGIARQRSRYKLCQSGIFLSLFRVCSFQLQKVLLNPLLLLLLRLYSKLRGV